MNLKSQKNCSVLMCTATGARRILTLTRRRPISYRNQSIDLLRKSMDWFLYDNGLRHERVKLRMRINRTTFDFILHGIRDDIALTFTAQKMKFSIKDFFSKYHQIRRKLQIWSHLLKNS